MKTEKEKLVDLAAFRERNGLKQEDLAQLLGVNRSYISQVEIGSCRISADKVKKIWELGDEYKWFMDDFVPAYSRLSKLKQELTEDFAIYDLMRKNRSDGSTYVQRLSDFEAGLEKVLSLTVLESIRLGQQGIDSVLADRIISVIPECLPPVSREWLMTGEGAIYVERKDQSPQEHHSDPNQSPSIDDVMVLLEKMSRRQEVLESMIKEIKAFLLNKS